MAATNVFNWQGRRETYDCGLTYRLMIGKASLNMLGVILCVVTSFSIMTPANARDFGERYWFDVEEETLGSALEIFVTLTESQLILPHDLAASTDINPVTGYYTIQEALDVLLRNTEFSGGLTKSDVIVISLKKTINSGENEMGNNKRSFLAGVIAALIGSGDSLAEEVLNRSSSGLEEIIVTAQRRDERLQDVPISISIFTQENIAKNNIVNPTDLAVLTPSLSSYQRYGPEKGYFLLRGFTQEVATAPSVGVYFAEVAAPRGGGGTTSGNGAIVGDFFDLQNVQVLKGPQGTLFGRNTTGGAVLLTPQRPTDNLEGYVEGSLGNYDMYRVQGVLNLPVSDSLKVRLGVDRQSRDGYMQNHSGIGPRRYNDVNYLAGRLSILADITPSIENYTILRYSKSDTNGHAGRIVGCNPDASGGRAILFAPAACTQLARQNARGDDLLDVEINNPDGFQEITQWQATNSTTWEVKENLSIKGILSYGEIRERASFTLGGDNFSVSAPGHPADGTPFMYATIAPQPGEDNSPQSTLIAELQLQGESWGGDLIWQMGGYHERSRPLGFSAGYTANVLNCVDISEEHCFNPLGSGSLTATMTKDYYDTTAAYAQGTYKFTEKWAITTGLRYTQDKVRGVGQTTRILFDAEGNQVGRVCFDSLRFQGPQTPDGSATPLYVTDPAECANEIRVTSEKPTWLVNLEYRPNSDDLLYLKYARGSRQGGLSLNNVGLETWEPEKVDTYEIGLKKSFHGLVPGYLNVAAFYNDFSSQQLPVVLVGKPDSGFVGGLGIVNAGKSKIWGLELDSSMALSDRLTVNVAYSYLRTKLDSISLPTIPEPNPFAMILPGVNEGDSLAYAPRNKVSISSSYILPFDQRIGEISVGMTYVYTDRQNATSPQSSPYYKLPSTDILNLNVAWQDIFRKPVDLSFFMTNLTDERYPVGIGSQYATAGYELIQVAPPRMWGLRFHYRFDG